MEAPISNASTKRIAVVTGANKGIGLEICKQLASHGIMLDVADSSSVSSLANFIETEYGKLDILENGFDIFKKLLEVAQETYEKAEECLTINCYVMKRVIEALIPLLQLGKSPRIVNISSIYGQLRFIPSASIRKNMDEIDEKTEERLDEVLQSYFKDFKEGKLKDNGWPTPYATYKLSKVAMNNYTRILAVRYPSMCVNCVSPGFFKTDINYDLGMSRSKKGLKAL
ncbi:uncharacterized protein A4U43_C04F7880 [Asparagus officinalis]|uniref:Uncharacterized protein n=1 Tax=Asparagus officinalis TaxID=4686 RepID=A0A5P1F0X4_ASPOF|nr:uncharacterized protein A4U43_C04F7880 [Asparagus officinalis]